MYAVAGRAWGGIPGGLQREQLASRAVWDARHNRPPQALGKPPTGFGGRTYRVVCRRTSRRRPQRLGISGGRGSIWSAGRVPRHTSRTSLVSSIDAISD